MTIGNRIRKAREAKGYSQKCVAVQLDLTQSGYRKIETDEVKLKVETLMLLCQTLEAEVTDLLYEPSSKSSLTRVGKPNQLINAIQHTDPAISTVEISLLKQLLECKEAHLVSQQKLLSEYEREITQLRLKVSEYSCENYLPNTTDNQATREVYLNGLNRHHLGIS